MYCPDLLTVSWVEIPPYIYNTTEGKIGGVFHSILSEMVYFCCDDRTNLTFSEYPVHLSKFQAILDNGTDDILLPVYGSGKKKDRLGEPFISLGKNLNASTFTMCYCLVSICYLHYVMKDFKLCLFLFMFVGLNGYHSFHSYLLKLLTVRCTSLYCLFATQIHLT